MKKLQKEEEFDRLLKSDSVLIFKHSTRCPISSDAYRQLESLIEEDSETPLFILNVVEDRALARYVAEKTSVRHESPQVIVLERGKVIWHASHFDITTQKVREYLN